MKLTILVSHLTSTYLDKYAADSDTFIETGAWLGDNAELVRQYGFWHVYSIEGDKDRFEYCQARFEGKPNIHMQYGDSPTMLRALMLDINRPATIWLDSPSKPTGHPILDELRAIGEHPIKTHTIFIDDRRLFGSEEWGLHVTEEKAVAILREINPSYQMEYLDGEVREDIIVASLIAT